MAVGLDIFKALLSRLLFAAHSLVTIFWVTEHTKNPKFWYLAAILVALAIETVHCIICRRGQENKWVSFSILCYLTTIIPCAWIMELHLLNERTQKTTATTNSSPIKIDTRNFTDLIEQTTLLILILGRWLLPKGSLSRESLSQLLLVNLAMSADIIEFFDILKLEQARKSRDLVLTILSLWTISLLQFPLTGTAKLDDQKDQVEPSVSNNDKNSISSNHTKQGRRQPRVSVDTSLLQAPLSDRRLSIAEPQSRRSSAVQMLSTCESVDVLSVLPDNHMKKLNLKRNSVAVTSNGNITDNLSRDRAPRRLSFDVRSSNLATKTSEDFLSNKIPRRYSRDVQTSSRASVDITADRFTARANFERLGSLGSAESTVDDDKPKHRVTMDLIGTTMALFLQDGPFLTFRLYVIAQYSAFQYMIVFLTVKNALLVVLQIYKITVQHCICYDHKDNDFSPENHVDATSRLNNIQIAVIHEKTENKRSRKGRRGRYNRFSVRWTRTKTRITQSGPLFHERQVP